MQYDTGITSKDGGRRILVVDDHRDGADALGELLRLDGAQVHVVYDEAAALEEAMTFRPTVVYLDLTLAGGVDGCVVARQIRERMADPVRLIALTGWGRAEDRRRCLEAGFDDFIVKSEGVDRVLGASR
jgi:DNA-binding response OmpR family regulator